ncbi:hypothetical protein D1631_05930 [Chryseobacterium nematophagum]|uniref:Lipoprotein n=1 Tax=Chryseobacterium nematophagum TaxID=2305228 RepID=A0A3M7TH01_9FLAO|nr:hypothetical protein [Chryseobacterium nematophagum]RNA61500.1 hypothetical protein D1631_05930 [Chryseobacterium nematophagum]
MKKSFYIILTSLLAVSCSSNDDQTIENPKSVEKEVYQFQYKNYTVQNITVYKGPSGQKIDVPESYLNSYWSTYQEPAWKKISLDLKNNSLKLISGTSADIKYPVNIEKDSVFINENSGNIFVGIFNKNEASFTLKRSFRYVKKMPRENVNALNISQKTVFGMTVYQDIFGKSVFDNPSSMDATGDDILWTNMDYYYKNL